jgi:hypothetical protein
MQTLLIACYCDSFIQLILSFSIIYSNEFIGMPKIIKLKDKNYEELKAIGNYGDTMDDIIYRCVQAYKKVNKL